MPGIEYAGDVTIAIRVSDIERSIGWYQDTLGMELLYRVDEIGWCELATKTKDVQIGLSQVEDARGSAGCVPTFGVVDIDRARAFLESKEVRFDGPTQTIEGMVMLATFYDPDGNPFMLAQSLQ
ncbi:MAG TPA: VOC family protein [Phycisphaerales bacterium]|nr:VOC family protein [Phycisphaerales bacterium]